MVIKFMKVVIGSVYLIADEILRSFLSTVVEEQVQLDGDIEVDA